MHLSKTKKSQIFKVYVFNRVAISQLYSTFNERAPSNDASHTTRKIFFKWRRCLFSTLPLLKMVLKKLKICVVKTVNPSSVRKWKTSFTPTSGSFNFMAVGLLPTSGLVYLTSAQQQEQSGGSALSSSSSPWCTPCTAWKNKN